MFEEVNKIVLMLNYLYKIEKEYYDLLCNLDLEDMAEYIIGLVEENGCGGRKYLEEEIQWKEEAHDNIRSFPFFSDMSEEELKKYIIDREIDIAYSEYAKKDINHYESIIAYYIKMINEGIDNLEQKVFGDGYKILKSVLPKYDIRDSATISKLLNFILEYAIVKGNMGKTLSRNLN